MTPHSSIDRAEYYCKVQNRKIGTKKEAGSGVPAGKKTISASKSATRTAAK
jgi:hypothetical protein